jgi:hypothetical protein
MTDHFPNPKPMRIGLRAGHLALAGLALLISTGDHAAAASARSESTVQSIDSRTAGDPIMAIVSLRSQRITIYDANGWILRAPMSSGQKECETPAGIFSVPCSIELLFRRTHWIGSPRWSRPDPP